MISLSANDPVNNFGKIPAHGFNLMYDRISRLVVSDLYASEYGGTINNEHLIWIDAANICSFVLYISKYGSHLTSYFPMWGNNDFRSTHNLCNIQCRCALSICLAKINFSSSHEDGYISAFEIFG